ncbi:MAG: MBG domain-containing protein [Candidatus Didemnitutus sp.]|nr:MBG domain-containing protein [Candidatus Didemnitutus sp.]
MNFSPQVSRSLFWLNLPSTVLMVLLQRLPVLKQVSLVGQTVLASPLGAVLRSTLVGATSLGAVNTLVGATELESSTPDPATATVGAPFNVAFTISGTPSAPTSWSVGGLPPGLTASGTSVLVVQGTPTTAGTYDLALTARNPNGSAFFSYTIIVQSNAAVAPSITTHPESRTVSVGANVTFVGAASGTPTPSLQWRKDGQNLPDQTSTTLTLTAVQGSASGTYTLAATNSAGTAISNGAVLVVVTPPTVTIDPQSGVVTVGAGFSFSVTTSGTAPFTYQWRRQGNAISGATSNPYTVASATLAHAGDYDVVVTNSAGSAISGVATLTVNKAPAEVSLGNLSATYDGTPKSASATTNPTGLTVVLTYDGSPTPPTNAGNYAVSATVNDAAFQGSSSGTLVINRATQTLTFDPIANRPFSSTPLALVASSNAGLPVALSVISGPASLDGSTLTMTGAGTVTVRAAQAGSANFFGASVVDRSFVIGANFASWQLDYFSVGELANAALSGTAADPDGDGQNNLLEYALGRDPRLAEGATTIALGRTETEWSFTYTRPAERADVVYVVEVSTNLTAWTQTGVVHEMVSEESGVATWRARSPASAANAFFRLSVSLIGGE